MLCKVSSVRDDPEHGWHTWWQAELRMLEIEVDDLSERVHFGRFEIAYELGEAFFELRICGNY
jgi:hypothetical protein